VNVILWPTVLEPYGREALGASMLGVFGIWRQEEEVRHLVAKRLVDLTHLLGALTMQNRDFR
jgi:error-prone DNA polymerase